MLRNLCLAISLALAVPAVALADDPAPTPTKDAVKKGPADTASLKKHLTEMKYPASKAELVASTSKLTDLGDADKKWFADTLPDGTYKSADDVVKALGVGTTEPAPMK